MVLLITLEPAQEADQGDPKAIWAATRATRRFLKEKKEVFLFQKNDESHKSRCVPGLFFLGKNSI